MVQLSLGAVDNRYVPPASACDIPPDSRSLTVRENLELVATDCATYAKNGLALTGLGLGASILMNALHWESFPTSTLQGFVVGALFGPIASGLTLGLVTEPSLSIGQRLIDRADLQNPTARKACRIAVVVFGLAASIYITALLYSSLQAHILTHLAPDAQALLTYFRGGPYTGPSEVPPELWNTALFALGQLRGFASSCTATHLHAALRKAELIRNETPLNLEIVV